MSTKGAQFQPVPVIAMDDDIDAEQSDEEHKLQPNSHLAKLEAMHQEYTQRLSTVETESKYNDKPETISTQNDKIESTLTLNTDDSILLHELADINQKVPPKLNYNEHEFGLNDPDEKHWKYHPRLGDLEKRQIILTYVNNNNEMEHKQETLWFAKDCHTSIRKVFISIKIKRISAIDNIKETFRMRFHMYLNWIMNETEYKQYKYSNTHYEPTWKPDLEFMNAVEIHRQEMFPYPKFGKYKVEILEDFWVDEANELCHESQFDPSLCYFIRTKLECDITFAEELELQSFPFDCQDLSCIIKGNFLNKQKYIFLPELRHCNFASIDPRYSVLDEWDLSTALIEFADDESGRTSGRAYPTIVIRLKMQRKWRIYVINIVLLLCALCGLSLCAFYLNYEQLGERLGLLITLILTSVAFSIVIQDKLPNVAYLTFIDKYILMSYLFLILVMIESVYVSTIDDEDDREKWDIFLFYVYSVLWIILMGIVFMFYGYILRKKEKKKLFYSSDQINAIVNKAMPKLVFDYKNSHRTGIEGRILSFMAEIKTNKDTPDIVRDKSYSMFEKYNQFVRKEVKTQRRLSQHQNEAGHKKSTRRKPKKGHHVPADSVHGL
eukprot:447785_1